MINLMKPYVPKEAIEAASEVLRSGYIAQGDKVDKFEKIFMNRFNVQHAVSVNSGTSALEMAYELIGIKPGDEVISTPLTCLATNLPLLKMGAKIIWADILEDTLCIDPKDVRRKITNKTKAIVQVHLEGLMANVGSSANDFNDDGLPDHIPVVSDASQSLGIFGGDYTICSFQAVKHITTIEGGMLICPNEDIERKARLMRWYGIDRSQRVKNEFHNYKSRKMTFDVELVGYKKNFNDVSAAMGIVGLSKYDDIIDHRRRLFRIYARELAGCPGIRILDCHGNVYGLCTALVDRRDDFAKKMFENEIDTNLVHLRNDSNIIFGGKRADLPVLNELEDKYTYLPLGMHVSEDEVLKICETIIEGW